MRRPNLSDEQQRDLLAYIRSALAGTEFSVDLPADGYAVKDDRSDAWLMRVTAPRPTARGGMRFRGDTMPAAIIRIELPCDDNWTVNRAEER